MEILIENLTMMYKGGKKALNDITLELKRPNLIGLIGPNGAGKSTLMNLLVGALLPTKGVSMCTKCCLGDLKCDFSSNSYNV